MSKRIKVMTFNLRVDLVSDGINSFFHRRDRVLEVIKNHNPDIISFQEATDSMRQWLKESLTDYILVGCGRDELYDGESTPIAYKKEKFDLVELKNLWLSNTPNVPGSSYGLDQSRFPRIFTSAIFNSIETKKTFLYINTHLDHIGVQSRILSAKQLIEYIKEKELSCILTGDFNALPNSLEIKEISSFLKDLTINIGGTYHGFGKEKTAIKIDYIFTNLISDEKETYMIDEGPSNGIYLSDHNPVCGFIEIK